MTPMIPFLVAILGCFTMAAQQYDTLQEIEQILKIVAAQTAPKHRDRNSKYYPRYSALELKQKNQEREEDDNNYDSAQSMEFYQQLDNMKIEKQLEDDLQQALTSESNRICKATGRCGCSRGRCGREYKAVDRTVNEMEHLLKELNKDINKQRNRNFRSDEDRRQKKYNKKENRRPKYDDRGHDNDDRRQKQEQGDRSQELEDRQQEYKVQANYQDDDNPHDDDIINKLGIATRNYKTSDFDILVLEVPESNELQNRANDIKIVDVRETAIKDLLQQQQTLHDKKEEKDRRVTALNLEDFVAYYNKIKAELTNGLLKYIKGSGDGSNLASLLPYQKKQIQHLKNLQVKKPRADDDLKAKIIALLFGSSSNIKILPHSKDSQTIYIPQQVVDAIPSVIRQTALRSRLFPLTYYQKQRQRNRAPRNFILKHSWRRNNEQTPNYGVPFNLQIQGLGQVS